MKFACPHADIVSSLSTRYLAKFYIIDIDNSPSVDIVKTVRVAPTFFLFKGGQLVETVAIPDPQRLENAVAKYV